jgi:hypothetical protein
MPYTSIPTLADGQILSASWLNNLAANQSFLYGLANAANIPFNSFKGNRQTLDSHDMIWSVRHKVPWLHWQIKSGGAGWNYARIWYNGVVVGESLSGTLFTGQYDLSSWAGLPHLVGAWASGTVYDNDVHDVGSTGANGDDGSVVTQGGQYYRCILDHTAAAANQPGVGASWTTYWNLLTLPGVGTMCQVYADVNFNTGQDVSVDYLVETDSSSF